MRLKNYLVNKMLKKWESKDNERLKGKIYPEGIKEINNIDYAGDNINGHLLDIYYKEQLKSKLPVFIDIHGGGFMSGSKEIDRLFGFHMADRGFLVFNLNYRITTNEVKVPDQIRDISLASKWINENLEHYSGDACNVFICGHSAGAVLALMEVLNSQSPRLRKIYDLNAGGIQKYRGILLDCGMMTFYENTIGYWGMRTMAFDKGYEHREDYKNMLWKSLTELSDLPKAYLVSNSKDELRHMTLEFKKILDEKHVSNKLDFQTDGTLGHTSIVYEPSSNGNAAIIDRAMRYLCGAE